ncbi:MAG: hypothetical protein L6R39_002709 [Caloplaca ligustica]|nr:MAG: hypothetical protein L6R39_002709 [Caloplaca ligustica]
MNDLNMAEKLPICQACGSQYDAGDGSSVPFDCKICNFAIGQRAILIRTPHGNVLWDLISLIDEPLRKFVCTARPSFVLGDIPDDAQIEQSGGLEAIVISHPHFYTTYVEWAEWFDCPVYMSVEDNEWLCREPTDQNMIKYIEGPVGSYGTILPGVTAIKAGGHFPGSLVLHWDDQLFVADTIMTVPSAHTPHPRPPTHTSYTFQWSIPNMIPLDPDEISGIWRAIKPYDFHTTYGAFNGMTVRDKALKARVLQSMKIQTVREGWVHHELVDERVS